MHVLFILYIIYFLSKKTSCCGVMSACHAAFDPADGAVWPQCACGESAEVNKQLFPRCVEEEGNWMTGFQFHGDMRRKTAGLSCLECLKLSRTMRLRHVTDGETFFRSFRLLFVLLFPREGSLHVRPHHHHTQTSDIVCTLRASFLTLAATYSFVVPHVCRQTLSEK